MKGFTLAFSCALFLLMDLVRAERFPRIQQDALLLGMSGFPRPGGSRRTAQHQQSSRLPLYMMHLYRTLLAEDRTRTPARAEDNPRLHESDSVTSLVARSKYSIFQKPS